jgi:hypothetical protein
MLSHKTSHDLKSPINNMLVFSLIDVSKINDPGNIRINTYFKTN